MRSLFLIALALLVISPLTFAAQLRLSPSGSGMETDPYTISSPDVSQVFFGDLRGAPVYYKFTASAPLDLHLQLLAPYADGYDANNNKLSIYLATESRMEIAFIYEDSYFPSTYFEKSGGDYYFAAPLIRRNLSAGTYIIKLYSTDNAGRYALAIGTREEVGIESLFAIAVAKQQIFAQPVLWNLLQLVGLIIITGCVAALYFAVIVTKKSKETNRIAIDFYYRIRYVVCIGIVLALGSWYAIYSANTSSLFGTIKTAFLVLATAHWIYFFAVNNKKFAKIREKKALLAPKFQNSISRHMIAQMILLIVVLAATVIV